MGVIRDIDRLKPELAKRTRAFLAELKKRGIEAIVLETDRTTHSLPIMRKGASRLKR